MNRDIKREKEQRIEKFRKTRAVFFDNKLLNDQKSAERVQEVIKDKIGWHLI